MGNKESKQKQKYDWDVTIAFYTLFYYPLVVYVMH